MAHHPLEECRALSGTALEAELLRTIAAGGPLALDRYMALCLGHARHGYYTTREPFGITGDFITAPEITQMFGEMIGVWCAQAFELMGSPEAFDLIELGPGRGTLMADVLRSAKVMPGFLPAARVRLVETSPRLRGLQERTLASWQGGLSWHDSLDQIEAGPGILIANEFFDALPVRQFRRTQGGWRERVVEASEEKLALGWKPSLLPPAEQVLESADGDVVEVRPVASKLAQHISARLAGHPGAALIVDYGHVRSTAGATLQAVRSHRMVCILDRPGESDLTAHVDFEILAKALKSNGARVWAPLTQREFLLGMGLEVRAHALKSVANGAPPSEVDAAVARLSGADQMGELFKVIAATSPGLARPHPFVTQLDD
ncbi:MAG: SAM-dependent methyltransferase [Pseudomonadota bacterium]|nr:SAM-dependent methyltransferase [Pseudomonadota bacterium]